MGEAADLEEVADVSSQKDDSSRENSQAVGLVRRRLSSACEKTGPWQRKSGNKKSLAAARVVVGCSLLLVSCWTLLCKRTSFIFLLGSSLTVLGCSSVSNILYWYYAHASSSAAVTVAALVFGLQDVFSQAI